MVTKASVAAEKAIIARAEYIVEVLSTRLVRDGWAFDHARAELLLRYMRSRRRSVRGEKEMHDWMVDHGQSFDWLFNGDPVSMIATMASTSPGRRQRRVLKLV